VKKPSVQSIAQFIKDNFEPKLTGEQEKYLDQILMCKGQEVIIQTGRQMGKTAFAKMWKEAEAQLIAGLPEKVILN
jgi:hypothetical protein